MDIQEIPLTRIDGTVTSLSEYAGRAILIVNVASKCGNTPQYAGLQRLYETYANRGFTILGFPCNQFLAQEPGSASQIQDFCTLNYGVTFPLMSKIKVNGRHRHPLYDTLTEVPDANGKAGKVEWNFEKFLLAPNGTITRFRPGVQPEDPAVITAIESALPA